MSVLSLYLTWPVSIWQFLSVIEMCFLLSFQILFSYYVIGWFFIFSMIFYCWFLLLELLIQLSTWILFSCYFTVIYHFMISYYWFLILELLIQLSACMSFIFTSILMCWPCLVLTHQCLCTLSSGTLLWPSALYIQLPSWHRRLEVWLASQN